MQPSRITVDPTERWGTPCLRDTGVSVGRVIELIRAGYTTPRILAELPVLAADDIDAAVEWFADFGPDGVRPAPLSPGHPLIAVDPEVQGGHPTVRGTRITVDAVLGLWESGFDLDEIVAEFPTLTVTEVEAAIAYAADAGQ